MNKLGIGVASAALSFVIGISAVGAQPPGANYGQSPSCSLYPTQLGNGEYTFTNHATWPIPLTVWDNENEHIQYQDFLGGGDTTPAMKLGPDSGIGWSNNHENDDWTDPANATYSLGAYEQVNWCNEEPTTTTTETPPTTIPETPPTTQPETPPTTTTTEPELPPGTVPETTTTTASVVASTVLPTSDSTIPTQAVAVTAQRATDVPLAPVPTVVPALLAETGTTAPLVPLAALAGGLIGLGTVLALRRRNHVG